MYSKEVLDRKIGILDWGIILSLLILFIMVYVPQAIWQEEVKLRNEARHRMTAISHAEEFYNELTGKFTMDGEHLFELVEAAMDSLLADSLFTGEKAIILNDRKYNVNIETGFDIRVDTTFSNAVNIKEVKLDTIYTVGLKNEESGGLDTLFINRRDIYLYQADTLNFGGIFSSDTSSRSEIITDYLRKKYHLSNELLYCPITGDRFKFKIDESDIENPVFTVSSPVPEDYTEPRYLIFQFEAGTHGSIIGGNTTWADE